MRTMPAAAVSAVSALTAVAVGLVLAWRGASMLRILAVGVPTYAVVLAAVG